MIEEEYWVSNPKFVCVIAKYDIKQNQLFISQQGVPDMDDEVEKTYVDQQCKVKVDPLSKQGQSDLLLLNELNEENCLHSIRVRYAKQQIYTQVGIPIMIAINPYQNMGNLYSMDTIKDYKLQMKNLGQVNPELLQLKLREIEPHLYKVTSLSLDELFKQTMKQNRICSMIISGESGSGKTESTKIILKYIAKESQGGLFETISQQPTLEEQVFASNPMLEAFGNAKTARNDNSSRFGKFIHIYFNANTKRIQSALIDNYLLEKSRVVKLSSVERNYHIFYQLISAKLPQYYLKEYTHYRYLKDGEEVHENEQEEFQNTCECLRQMNFKNNDIDNIFKIIAGILHLGNIKIQGDQNQSFLIDDEELEYTIQLLGIGKEQLKRIICNELTTMMKQQILKENNIDKAYIARDTLAKYIYNKLFNWLISKVNLQLNSNKQSKSKDKPFMIGILDIFGFEIFSDEQGLHTNSFEQLNINFTNEKLQQHFNAHMLETEQTEYNAENIKWQHIQFPDNKNIIDLIENSKLSIFKLLIDQCIAPKGNDKDYLNSFKNLPQQCLILRDNIQTADLDPRIDRKAHRLAPFDWFCVKHFAGGVIYNVEGFVEKNKDSINQEVHSVLSESSNPVIKELQKEQQITSSNIKESNVLTTFQSQLKDLLAILNKSIPKYIRCIKPNNLKQPFLFDAVEVRRQMRCAGLMEAIQIRKAGYEIRINHDEFIKKYRYLVKGKPTKINQMLNLLAENTQVKNRLVKEMKELTFQIGKTKIYMKESLQDYLENLLIQYRMVFLKLIQKNARVYIFRKTVLRNLKKLCNKLHKIAKSIKKYLFRLAIQKRIERRRKYTKCTNTINDKCTKLVLFYKMLKLKQYSQFRKEEMEKVQKMELELKQQLGIQEQNNNNNKDQQQEQQQRNVDEQFYSSQSFQKIENQLDQSTHSTMNTKSTQQFINVINQYELKLAEEQKKNKELMNQKEQLESKIRDLEQMGEYGGQRETINMSQFDDIFQLQRLTQEKAQIEIELEQVKSEKIINEKKLNKQIHTLNSEILELRSELENISMEYLSAKQKVHQIEDTYEEQIQQLKNEHIQQIEHLKQQDQGKHKIHSLTTEVELKKRKIIELEADLMKEKQRNEILKSQIENSEVEVINDHSKCIKERQLLENEIREQQQQIQQLQLQIQRKSDDTKSSFQQDQQFRRMQEEIQKKEKSHAQNKKLISVMNSIIKIKILEINSYCKYFKVSDSTKKDIYKEIHQIMDKEKVLMKQFEELLQVYKNSNLDESMQSIKQQ